MFKEQPSIFHLSKRNTTFNQTVERIYYVLTVSNLELRSPTARRKGDLVKFHFEHAARPDIWALLLLRMYE